ncbi:MAG: histidinol-phosphatase HisJ family protein [Mariprofundaceae bacterium]
MIYKPVPDYHMHTPRCKHAIGSVREYAIAALKAGLKEIGISDHSPMPSDFDHSWRMKHDELDSYLREVEAARDEFAGRLQIRIGLEADYYPGTESYISSLIRSYPWDYIIGSVHYIDDWGFDNEDEIRTWQERDIEDTYCSYHALVEASAESGLFDIIGHPDLIKKFGHRPPLDSRKVRDAEESMLQAIHRSGCTLEISSAGLRKPVAEVYPHGRIIALAAEIGIPFSFGSDAHAPGEVGHAMHSCLSMLQACGIDKIQHFEGRHRFDLSITPA